MGARALWCFLLPVVAALPSCRGNDTWLLASLVWVLRAGDWRPDRGESPSSGAWADAIVASTVSSTKDCVTNHGSVGLALRAKGVDVVGSSRTLFVSGGRISTYLSPMTTCCQARASE